MDRVRVMQSLFVLSKAFPDLTEQDFYAFRAYHFGPFDAAVNADADLLAAGGLVENAPGRYPWYAATPAGVQRANLVAEALPPGVLDYVHTVREWANGLDFNTLVRAIYQRWPEMRAHTVWRG